MIKLEDDQQTVDMLLPPGVVFLTTQTDLLNFETEYRRAGTRLEQIFYSRWMPFVTGAQPSE